MQLALMRTRAYLFVIDLANDRSGEGGDRIMKVWTKPAVREQEVGLEVTSYLPAEIDII